MLSLSEIIVISQSVCVAVLHARVFCSQLWALSCEGWALGGEEGIRGKGEDGKMDGEGKVGSGRGMKGL